MNRWVALFVTFLKVNLLTTSGSASVGLLYSEAVNKLMSHEEFVEAVGYSSVLPGSDALQLAMFVGYRVGGVPGALIACLGAILPPTVIMLSVAAAPALVVPTDRPALRHILLCSGDLWYPAETVRLVGQIAQAAQAEVTLLYVIPQPLLHYPILREIEDAWGALLQTDTPQGRNLKAGRDTLRRLGIETGVKLRHGPVAQQIMAEIREGEYDLVALGSTYAAQGLRRYFASGITDLVVERAGRPVLVVRHRHGVSA